MLSLFNHNGVIREFSAGEEIVNEIALHFNLNEAQSSAHLETVYRKENRIKRSSLWHRLLFRAADSLANQSLVSRPTTTAKLTGRREWMLTEMGFDSALNLLNIPIEKKEQFSIKSFEVEKIAKKIHSASRPVHYDPISQEKKIIKVEKDVKIRLRGFRQAVIEAYDFKCAVCGLKLCTPDFTSWEVEAAHIVPHGFMGKDDIWNGLALCRLHHWAFDAGWFTLTHDLKTEVSVRINDLPNHFGTMHGHPVFQELAANKSPIFLPKNSELHPHVNSINWHREVIFSK